MQRLPALVHSWLLASGRRWRRQHGVVSRAQLHDRGFTDKGIASQVAAGRWQRPLPGVIVVFTGPLPALTTCCAALIHAGADAVLSHSTAGVLWQLVPGALCPPIHVTVPIEKAPRSRRGLVVHRTALPIEPIGCPPRTSVAETIVALCGQARRPSEVTAVLGRAAQRYPDELRRAQALVAARRNVKWRAEILHAADDVLGGAHSVPRARGCRAPRST